MKFVAILILCIIFYNFPILASIDDQCLVINTSTFKVISRIPKDKTLQIKPLEEIQNIISAENYLILNAEECFNEYVYDLNYPFLSLTSPTTLDVNPGTYSLEIIPQIESEGFLKMKITLIRKSEMIVSSLKNINITPQEFDKTINIKVNDNLNTLEKFTGPILFKILNLPVDYEKEVLFTDGVGILDITELKNFPPILSRLDNFSVSFNIHSIPQVFFVSGVDGIFKLKD